MMQFGKLIVLGTVSKVVDRDGVSKETGRPWRIVTLFVPHDLGAYGVLLCDDLLRQPLPEVGDEVALECYPSIFNGRVDLNATAVWDAALPERAL